MGDGGGGGGEGGSWVGVFEGAEMNAGGGIRSASVKTKIRGISRLALTTVTVRPQT